MSNQFQKTANRVTSVSIIGNLLLSTFKLIAGLLANSGAMISDAVHSASDVFSSIVVIIGIHVSSKESDKEHPYGHERLECVAAIILAVILFITGISIGISAVKTIASGHYADLAVPGILALVAAVISIATKEAMFWYTKINATRIDSAALMADAWHHRSDALSSVGALVGIAGVLRIDDLRTREFGNKIYVDVEIAADGDRPLKETHAIAERVHDHIEKKFPKVKHVMVHVNPFE